jgi:thioredoxin-related protein
VTPGRGVGIGVPMSTHPHFDDKGLRWQTKLADALAEAKRDGKHVLVEFGREACGNCRTLVESILPAADVRAEIESHFVLLASDCDAPEKEIVRIGQAHMAHARSLPFVLYLDADGRFVHGSTGARSKHALLHDLQHGREDPGHHHGHDHDH